MTLPPLIHEYFLHAWAWLTCWDAVPFAFHHNEIRIVQEFENARKLRCDRCGKYFAMSDTHQAIVPWCDDLEKLYADILKYGATNR